MIVSEENLWNPKFALIFTDTEQVRAELFFFFFWDHNLNLCVAAERFSVLDRSLTSDLRIEFSNLAKF